MFSFSLCCNICVWGSGLGAIGIITSWQSSLCYASINVVFEIWTFKGKMLADPLLFRSILLTPSGFLIFLSHNLWYQFFF